MYRLPWNRAKAVQGPNRAHWLRYPNLHSKTSKRYNSKSSDSSQERRTSMPVSNLVAIIPRRSVCVIGLRTKHSPNIASRSPPYGLCISRQVVPVIWTRVSCTFPSDKLIRGVNGFIQNRHRPSACELVDLDVQINYVVSSAASSPDTFTI